MDALALGLQTLLRLAARRPVVAVAGNHDSPELLRGARAAAAPARRAPGRQREASRRGRHPRTRRARRRRRVVAVLPVPPRGPGRRLHEGRRRVVPRLRGARRGDHRPRTTRRWSSAPGADLVPILVAHFLVNGVKMGRDAPRGERELHMGDAYAATPQAIPAGPAVRGDGPHPCAADRFRARPSRPQYAGSLLAARLRRGGRAEAGRDRRRRARAARRRRERSRCGAAGRSSGCRTRGTQIEARADELAGRVPRPHGEDQRHRHDARPSARARRSRSSCSVRAQRPAGDRSRAAREGRTVRWEELYAAYYRREHDEDAPDELLDLFRDVLEEAADATA